MRRSSAVLMRDTARSSRARTSPTSSGGSWTPEPTRPRRSARWSRPDCDHEPVPRTGPRELAARTWLVAATLMGVAVFCGPGSAVEEQEALWILLPWRRAAWHYAMYVAGVVVQAGLY